MGPRPRPPIAGQHTLTAVQSNNQDINSKPASVVFYVGPPPADARIDDTDLGFVYNQLDYSGNRGDIGIALDGGPQTTVDTVPADGQRHANVVVWSSPTLTQAVHTIVITKLSGTYMTFDGVDVANG
jgi:hypothetical protein